MNIKYTKIDVYDIMNAREPMRLHRWRTVNADHDSCEAT